MIRVHPGTRKPGKAPAIAAPPAGIPGLVHLAEGLGCFLAVERSVCPEHIPAVSFQLLVDVGVVSRRGLLEPPCCVSAGCQPRFAGCVPRSGDFRDGVGRCGVEI